MGTPTQIVLLRHAEKPDDKTDPDLSTKGQQRAAALAIAIPARFGAMDELFATKASKDSNRPVETLTPLSQRLQLRIRSKWKMKEVADLAAQILSGKFDGENLVVCWHHETLPELAAALRVRGGPASWSDGVFDRFWVITYDASGAASFADLPQHLLAGDTSV
jgi:broad specificity phosphatase PhoE